MTTRHAVLGVDDMLGAIHVAAGMAVMIDESCAAHRAVAWRTRR
jgi:hypothetical protein